MPQSVRIEAFVIQVISDLIDIVEGTSASVVATRSAREGVHRIVEMMTVCERNRTKVRFLKSGDKMRGQHV